MNEVTINEVRHGFYVDSVALMRLSQTIAQLDGVQEAALMMGTSANQEILAAARLLSDAGQAAQGGDLVIASKCFFPMSDDVNDRGLSRKHIFESIEQSLRRLGTDLAALVGVASVGGASDGSEGASVSFHWEPKGSPSQIITNSAHNTVAPPNNNTFPRLEMGAPRDEAIKGVSKP